ncbi:MAG: tyrosine-type recombinase/integrase [Actinomycetota bacterium]|nr:tyrosine-type recombinase/integrase [Actinomycetota bacterium]
MSARRRFGRVRKLPSGRWQARYPDPSGRDFSAPTTFATKGDANRWLVRMEADLSRGRRPSLAAHSFTLAELAERWLARPGKRPNSVVRDRQGLGALLSVLGTRPIASITPLDVQEAIDARAREVAPATLARDVASLRALFNAAVDAELLDRSPARKVALPRVRRAEHSLITPTELARLAEEVPPTYRVLVLVGGVLGLRWGEAIGLRRGDIDPVRHTVTVGQVVEEIAGQLRIVAGEAKTTGSLRTIAAPAFLIEALLEHLRTHRRGTEDDPTALVFLGARGGVLRRRFSERIFRPAARRAGLAPSLTFHSLRHNALTALVDENVHPRVMQSRAGHASSRLTLELYAHVTDNADREAAAALERRFGAGTPDSSGT